ncbi:MAG: 30S ribosomal protein S16 [Candidatus Goldbacteria bacterium]|nr:30S ribosomal protein S16 [Candidatus Goldiibacteriota bacterium]
MASVIRLKRMGKANTPFYRIVVIDEKKSAKGGKYIEELGHYFPLKDDVKINVEKTIEWLKKGAKISDTVKDMIKNTEAYKSMPKKKKKKSKKGEK